MELALYFKNHYRAGEPGYYDGRPRGTVAVWHDSQLWIYEQPPTSMRRDMKIAIFSAFCNNGGHLTGRFPEYRVN